MKLKVVICLLLQLAIVHGEVRITEFLASNDSVLVPGQAGTGFHDWIELENSGSAPVDIGGWALTDDPSVPSKWEFPAGTMIPGNSFIVVLANGNDGPDENGVFQTNFSLSASGEYVGLSDSSGSVVSSFGENGGNYPSQSSDISYGRSPVSGASVYFKDPTPGAENSATSLITSRLTLSAQRGYYDTPFSLTLSCADSESTISYTLDGRSPIDSNGALAEYADTYSGRILVSSTTILRAVAISAGAGPSPVETHSYIFPSSVAIQSRPSGYTRTWGGGTTADYSVDPRVSQSAVDGQRFLDGMRDLPTISVVTDKENIFGPDGLYLNTQSDIEKTVSAEYFEPDASGAGVNGAVLFQTDCGMRVQGGASRNPSSAPKHSLSLRFRAEDGLPVLDANLFPGASLSKFNALHLRANYNNSWIHRDNGQRERCNHFSDQFVRDSYIAMGHEDGVNGRFIHLFLNGLYWGVYNLHERPENDHYAAYSDGEYAKDEIFGYNPGNNTSAEKASFNQMKAACASGNWAEIRQRLDINSYIDFYIVQHYTHNDDLKTTDNWRAAGGGPSNAPWKFYPWDGERTLEDPTNIGELAISQDGAGIIDDLKDVLEFRVRFADRVYKHFFHDGALMNPANRARVIRRVNELDLAVVGESARWGDVRDGGSGPEGIYTRAENWLPSINGQLPVVPSGGLLGANGWFPTVGITRTERMISKWKAERWLTGGIQKLPVNDPPRFEISGLPQHGGTIPPGQQLTIAGNFGEIYFTTDGSDPRLEGGAIRENLVRYAGSAIPIDREGIIKVRWKNGDDWSALNEARFSTSLLPGAADLIIAEVNYHPSAPSSTETAMAPSLEDKDFQFLEILNLRDEPLNMAGCTISGGVEFTFPSYQLAAGERVVVVENGKFFRIRYPSTPAPAGEWSGVLSKGGEEIILSDAAGNLIDAFTYSDSEPWPLSPDGGGDSLNRLGISSNGDLGLSWTGASPSPGSGIVQDRFASWAQVNGLRDSLDDSDGDGISALLEYALLLDPNMPDTLPPIQSSSGIYSIDFSRDPGRSDYDVKVWGTENLETWAPLSEQILSISPNRENLRVAAPIGLPKYFLQIRTTAKP